MRALRLQALLLLFASPALAAGGEGPGIVLPALNLLLLLGVLFYFARKPILEFFAGRRKQIRKELEDAEALRREAEQRYTTWQRKIAELDAEHQTIREQSRSRAESEHAQIIADARATAARIRQDATAAIEQELRRSRAILHEEAADLAVELAGNLLREQVDDRDRERLVTEVIERIERSGAATGS